MLDVTVRVTKTPTQLEQIHHIEIVNRGPGFAATAQPDRCWYDVYLDGEYLDHQISHFRKDGALKLLLHALQDLKSGGMLTPYKASVGEEKEIN